MRIPIELKPYPDEILSSWLIRNSIANGSDPSSWVSGIWLEFRAWSRDIDRHLPKDKISKLSKITSLNKEQIKDLTLEPLIERITNEVPLNSKKAWYFIIPTGLRGTTRINGTHFCSKCLSNSIPYIKKQWRLAWNVACPIHKQLLISKCQKCNKTFSPHSIDYLNTELYICANCDYDLRDSDVLVANNDVINFQEDLNHAIFHNLIDQSSPLIKYTVHELFITVRILLSFFRALVRLSKHDDVFVSLGLHDDYNFSVHSKRDSFEAMDVRDKEILLFMLSKLFKLKLKKIKHILENSKITYKMLVQQLEINSKTIDYLSQNLLLSGDSSISVGIHHEIKPRGKEEVEALMDEIRKFI